MPMLLGQLVLLSVYMETIRFESPSSNYNIKKNNLIEKCGDKIPKKREKSFMCRMCETNVLLTC